MKRKTKIVVSNSQYKTQQWRKLAACVVAVANTPNTNTIYNILNTDAYPQHKTHNIGPSMKYGKYKPPYKTAIPQPSKTTQCGRHCAVAQPWRNNKTQFDFMAAVTVVGRDQEGGWVLHLLGLSHLGWDMWERREGHIDPNINRKKSTAIYQKFGCSILCVFTTWITYYRAVRY